MYDDEIIGLKSTSIKFKNNLKLFIFMSYSLSFFFLMILFKDLIGLNIFFFLFDMFLISLIYQLKFEIKNAKSCLKMFRLNNLSGLILFLTIFSLNY